MIASEHTAGVVHIYRIRFYFKFKIVEVVQTRSLRTLVKISQAGSFAQAAGQLGITLSTLSMQMKALETELGVALFDRNHRPPRLTPLAVSVVEQATAMLRHEDQMVELCRPSDTLVGHFKLGFVTTAAVRLLP